MLTQPTSTEDQTTPQMLLRRAGAYPNGIALRQKDFGVWCEVTWADYAQVARHLAHGFLSLGLQHGDRVAILSENRKEWVYSQLGAAIAGAVPAGIYPTSPAAEIKHLLALSEAVAIVCEDQEQVDKVLEVGASLPALRAIIVIDPRGLKSYADPRLVAFDALLERGREADLRHPNLIPDRVARGTLKDIALIIFTSGSTGPPKAAMVTWEGLLTSARGMDAVFKFGPVDNIVSYLPLCHMAEQMFSVSIPIMRGMTVSFAESLRTVQEDLREISPQAFFGVPRIWEKFHAGILTKIREAGGFRRTLFQRATLSIGRFADRPTRSWSFRQRCIWAFWYPLILRPLLNTIGLRRCRVAISAGAPISPDMLRFFRMLGVPIRELYGLTESSGAATLQVVGSPIGTVGRPIPGIGVELAEDGEILISGPTVFRGYLGGDAATRDAIDPQGRLRTGDVGEWVEGPEGRELRIIDRKKDIMITAGGKNITPSEIENALRFSPYIKEAIVIGDKRNFVSALIQIDLDGVSKWAEENGIAFTTFRSLAIHSEVRKLIEREVDTVNARMPRVQQVRKFHLLTKELDHDDGEVTATMKVKRKNISERYAAEIDGMYAT
jgi:long-chain acyl-CoA synthetase